MQYAMIEAFYEQLVKILAHATPSSSLSASLVLQVALPLFGVAAWGNVCRRAMEQSNEDGSKTNLSTEGNSEQTKHQVLS